jgi:hypothetical protein
MTESWQERKKMRVARKKAAEAQAAANMRLVAEAADAGRLGSVDEQRLRRAQAAKRPRLPEAKPEVEPCKGGPSPEAIARVGVLT